MKVSLFASSIRPHNWENFLNSLKSNIVEYEVVFAGFIDPALSGEITSKYPEFKYIKTGDIKPAQCYEIARRACTGYVVGWVSDDCIFPPQALDKIYAFHIKQEYKTITAVAHRDPECANNLLNDQRFFARNLNTPQMANLGFMRRELLEQMGGFDRRYVFGKFECDLCMRLLADGGSVVKFEDVVIEIEHTTKNWDLTNDWSGVNEDSETLENSWVVEGYKDFERGIITIRNGSTAPEIYYPISNREVTLKRKDSFEPFEDRDILTQSQSIRGRWM